MFASRKAGLIPNKRSYFLWQDTGVLGQKDLKMEIQMAEIRFE